MTTGVKHTVSSKNRELNRACLQPFLSPLSPTSNTPLSLKSRALDLKPSQWPPELVTDFLLAPPPNKQAFRDTLTLNTTCLLRRVFDVADSNKTEMCLPPELAMLVGSYLDPHDVRVCTTQLCSSGAEFVANLFANGAAIVRLHELVACCRLSAVDDGVAQECTKRIELFVARRRGNVQAIILYARLTGMHAINASMYSDFHRRLQQGPSFQLSQSQRVTVEWHVNAESISQIKFLLKVDVPKVGARVSDSSAGGALRQSLHTLNFLGTKVRDMYPLASCQSLHTLDLSYTKARDVSPLASCQSLHKLNLSYTKVRDMSPLASCQSLHKLDLSYTKLNDISALGSCQSLHTLNLQNTQVSDVSSLASCQSLHTLAGPRVYPSERCVCACFLPVSAYAGPREHSSERCGSAGIVRVSAHTEAPRNSSEQCVCPRILCVSARADSQCNSSEPCV
jgi:hypothetical protein